MPELVRAVPWHSRTQETEPLLTREWLVTNGLGGYASGTLAGVLTRRYHGLLVAALPAPFGRTMMFNDLVEQLRFPDGSVVPLGGEDAGESGVLKLHGSRHLKEFRLENGLPVWHFQIGGIALEKRLLLVHMQNTVHLTYELMGGDTRVRLELRPCLHFRGHDVPVSRLLEVPYVLTITEDQYEITSPGNLPPLRMLMLGECAALTVERKRYQQVLYRIEESRGYESRGDLWSPGFFHVDLSFKRPATLVASTEPWETVCALSPPDAFHSELERRKALICAAPPEARDGCGAELVLAADQFIITPSGRLEDVARARAAGDEVRTVIAGYHWFTDWGRDTMISLDGLTLATGRHTEAGWILRTFAYYIRDGLIPNMFPEGEKEGLYHTADATLWYFHALDRYLELTGDRNTLRMLLPKLRDIVAHHVRGTRFGISVDAGDGLLRQGEQGYQLTWMDAKVDDWVVTPRRGKAVEINALWYNALRLLQHWLVEEEGDAAAREIASYADRAAESFNMRFWYEEGGYLYDVVDTESGGDDPACRPNQVFAISLKHPVLDRSRWHPVMETIERRLLTPVGLRSLAPGHPDYKPQYYGDLRSRDAAYHQGTVWAWLIGPFIDAWLKLHPDEPGRARQFLEGFVPDLGEYCIGTIAEVFDAELPFHPRGCIAQAWSVAEVLRCWIKTAPQEQQALSAQDSVLTAGR
jgi:predicted glycogen debranching enzyme